MSTSPLQNQLALISAMGIELIELESFLVVAETGSFSAAAERLHVTQPSVTGRVQRLEAALGARLLDRTTRKAVLTQQGEALYHEATAALHGLRKLVAAFRQGASLARQRVVVAASPMLAALHMPGIIQEYGARFPDVQVELRDLNSAEALAALEAGAADVGIMALDERGGRFRFQPLWQDRMVLVIPCTHSLAGQLVVMLAELANVQLILNEQYLPMKEHIAGVMAQQGLQLKPCKTVGNNNTLFGMLDARMGIGLMPRSLARRCVEAGHKVAEIQDVELHREYGLVFSRKAEMNPACLSFCRFITGRAEQETRR